MISSSCNDNGKCFEAMETYKVDDNDVNLPGQSLMHPESVKSQKPVDDLVKVQGEGPSRSPVKDKKEFVHMQLSKVLGTEKWSHALTGNKKGFFDSGMPETSGREKLKKHRVEVAGHVWIPDIWGHEDVLKDWIDCSAFDSTLVPNGIMSARASLVEESRRSNLGGLRVGNRC